MTGPAFLDVGWITYGFQVAFPIMLGVIPVPFLIPPFFPLSIIIIIMVIIVIPVKYLLIPPLFFMLIMIS